MKLVLHDFKNKLCKYIYYDLVYYIFNYLDFLWMAIHIGIVKVAV
jgi:hypothetical protein